MELDKIVKSTIILGIIDDMIIYHHSELLTRHVCYLFHLGRDQTVNNDLQY